MVLAAKLNAEMERQTKRDTVEGPPAPLGQRGTYAADTIRPTEREQHSERNPSGEGFMRLAGLQTPRLSRRCQAAANPIQRRISWLCGHIYCGFNSTMCELTALETSAWAEHFMTLLLPRRG